MRINRVIAYLLFYPTLLWNLTLSVLSPTRHWWDEVDDHVLIGAFPAPWVVSRFHGMGVGAVVNMCAEAKGPIGYYDKLEINYLHLPTIDYSSPSLRQVEMGVSFIAEQAKLGHKTYVHCKAGRGRSAILTICWLIMKHDMKPEQAQSMLTKQRPHVNRHLKKRPVVSQFVEVNNAKRSSSR